MAKQTKKFAKVVRDLESAVGLPVVTGPRGTGGEVSPLFVAVFGKAAGASKPSLLGTGELVKDNLVLADLDVAAALADGATPTSVGIAWLTGSTPHTQARAIGEFGHREGEESSAATMWMLELATASTAPVGSALPPGAIPASGWCLLFPWLSMCHQN
ncbi:MAG: hypothetical protein QM711_08255 [Micropruina sp.]|uniref:hypothetical protein n=1 Tax=Micropruina sp. TaxID=2737536 RepID=UPI0039E5836A